MVKINSKKTEKTIHLLLSGKSKLSKKYAGKHVMVIGNKIVPLKEKEEGWQDFIKLEKKYGQAPVIVFVPRPDIAYILLVW